MQGINIFIGEKDLGKDWQATKTEAIVNNKKTWVVARPIGYISLLHRIKCAWLVFKQEADIVVWKYQ